MRKAASWHLLFALSLATAWAAQTHAQTTPAPVRPDTATGTMRADKGAPVPPGGTRAATQNEDDLYVGIKRSAGDARAPTTAGTAKPLTPQGPLAAQPAGGATKPLTPQGPLAKPLTPQGPLAAPGVAQRPGAGTSPNTGSSTRASVDTHHK